MTNVRCFLHQIQLSASLQVVCIQKLRGEIHKARLRAGQLASQIVTLLAGFVLLCALHAPAHAQDSYTFGQTPVGVAPSGSAGGTMVDSNRNGLGFSARMGHEAGNTVGRDDSASLFQLSPFVNIGNGMAFGDSRLTYTNDGGLAWSFGGGYRHYVTAWDAVVGAYGYTDRDNITGAHFKQWSFGGEILTNNWEARANWYEPYGDTSSQTGSRIAEGSQAFGGNQLLFDRVDTFSEALKGLDAEIGFLLPGKFSERFDIRGFGGGYWYEGTGVEGFTGFSTRLQADIGDWLELGLKLTDDEIFHTNVAFSATVHFGGFRSQEHTSRSAMQRMAEPVRRNLNIAATVSDVVTGQQVAQNTGGQNLVIVHVDSDAAVNGDGTFERPFRQLQQGLQFASGTPAQAADIVYVHAGSVYNTTPQNTVVLNSNQSLFGEGLIPHPIQPRVTQNTINVLGVGDLTLPSSQKFIDDPTLLRPMLVGSADPAVTLGDNSRMGGFIISGATGSGVVGNGVSDVFLSDLLIDTTGGDGVALTNSTGIVSLVNTEIRNTAGNAFQVIGGNANVTYRSTSTTLDPSFSAITNSAGAAVLIDQTTGGFVNMTGTTIDDTGGTGIMIGSATTTTVGSATIDNALITGSSATGISIQNASGTYRFRDTLRDATQIDAATQQSILIDNLTGQVSFENIAINAPGAEAIQISNLAGNVDVFGNIDVAGATSASPLVSITGSLIGSTINLGGDNNNFGGGTGGGTGMLFTNNASGSIFTARGQTVVSGGVGRGVDIENNDSTVQFGDTANGTLSGLSVLQTGAAALEGLRISNTTGPLTFNGITTIERDTVAPTTPPPLSLVDITNSTSPIFFNSLVVTEDFGNTGINMVGNGQGTDGNGRILMNDVTVATNGGTAFLGLDNHLIQTRSGAITADNAPAVDIENSGIEIALEEVNSANSPTYGIRLVDTNKDLSSGHPIVARTFTVLGTPVIGTQAGAQPFGGVIEDAAAEGVLLQNAGEVSLSWMTLDNNLYGIRVLNDLTDLTGVIRTDDDQFVRFLDGEIIDSGIRGIDATNLTILDVQDSIFTDNGTQESIYVTYTQRPNDPDTTTYDEFRNNFEPFIVNVQRSEFFDDNSDIILIENQTTTSAHDAHVGVNIEDNEFTMVGSNSRGFALDWEGPANVIVDSNAFTMTGAGAPDLLFATAISVTATSSTDLLELNVTNNQIGQLFATTQPGATGLRVETDGQASMLVANNQFRFDGLSSVGMEFDLGILNVMSLTENTLEFLEEGGTGVDFIEIGANSNFLIRNNTIDLGDNIAGVTFINGIPQPGTVVLNDPPDEISMTFQRARGVFTIQGTGNIMREIILPGNVFALTSAPLFPDFRRVTPVGSIEVNGLFVP